MGCLFGKVVEAALEDGSRTFARVVPLTAIGASRAVVRRKKRSIMRCGQGAPMEILNREIAKALSAAAAAVLMNDDGADVFDSGRKPEMEGGFERQFTRGL